MTTTYLGKQRSDSSSAFRLQLSREYVIVPDISPRIDIDRYIAIAKAVKDEAQRSIQKKAYSRAYIDYRKFLLLMTKIATHPSYTTRFDVKKWVKSESEAAFSVLEDIVTEMDAMQDILNEAALMAAFDGEDQNAVDTIRAEIISDLPSADSPTASAVSLPVPPPVQSSTHDPFSIFTTPKGSSSNTISALGTHAPEQKPQEQPKPPGPDEDPTQRAYARRQRIRAAFFVPSFEGEVGNSIPVVTVPSTASLYPSIESLSLSSSSQEQPAVGPTTPSASKSALSTPSSSMPSAMVTTKGSVVESKVDVSHYLRSNLATVEDIAILRHLLQQQASSSPTGTLGSGRSFYIPHPATKDVDFYLSPVPTGTTPQNISVFQAYVDDFHASFQGFLQPILPPELQVARSAVESNRCFYLHLGIATGLHPYLLQCHFRAQALHLLAVAKAQQANANNGGADGVLWFADLLESVLGYAGFVDANVLCLLWPRELDPYRICFISGSTRPIFSVFQKKSTASSSASSSPGPLIEVLLYCNGSHFTLLRPRNLAQNTTTSGFRVIDRLLVEARRQGLTVQENQVLSAQEVLGLDLSSSQGKQAPSVWETVLAIVQQSGK